MLALKEILQQEGLLAVTSKLRELPEDERLKQVMKEGVLPDLILMRNLAFSELKEFHDLFSPPALSKALVNREPYNLFELVTKGNNLLLLKIWLDRIECAQYVAIEYAMTRQNRFVFQNIVDESLKLSTHERLALLNAIMESRLPSDVVMRMLCGPSLSRPYKPVLRDPCWNESPKDVLDVLEKKFLPSQLVEYTIKPYSWHEASTSICAVSGSLAKEINQRYGSDIDTAKVLYDKKVQQKQKEFVRTQASVPAINDKDRRKFNKIIDQLVESISKGTGGRHSKDADHPKVTLLKALKTSEEPMEKLIEAARAACAIRRIGFFTPHSAIELEKKLAVTTFSYQPTR